MFKSTRMAAPPPRVKVKNAIVSLLLVAALVITGALAFLTAKDSAENIFTVGNVSLVLEEPNWNEENGKNIVGGQTVAKDPQVLNNGTVGAYVYLSVSVPKGEYPFVDDVTGATITSPESVKLFNYKFDETNWSQFAYVEGDDEDTIYYYYNKILGANETTEALFEEVSLINLISGSGVEGKDLQIVINGYGIQSKFDDSEIDTPEEAWNALVNQSGNTELPTVATSVELNFVNALGETAQTTIFKLEDAATTEITVPEIAVGGYSAYLTKSGIELLPGETISTESVVSDGIVDAENETVIITATQPAGALTIQGDGSSNPTKLMPVEGTNAVVYRNGIKETYYNGENSATTEYPYNDTDYSRYFLYGIERRQEKISNFNNLFTVQGDGYAVVYPSYIGNYTTNAGTGTIVEVYNADNTLSEKFTVIMWGDVDGNGRINAGDSSILWSVTVSDSPEYSDFNPTSSNFNYPAFIAGDINGNNAIDAEDYSLHSKHIAVEPVFEQAVGTLG